MQRRECDDEHAPVLRGLLLLLLGRSEMRWSLTETA